MLLFVVPLGWMFLSTEMVRLSSRELAMGRKFLGIGRMREFDLANVKDLRMGKGLVSGYGRGASYASFSQAFGTLVFDYGYKTYRFGTGLEEAEAKYLLSEIGSRFPAIMEKAKAG